MVRLAPVLFVLAASLLAPGLSSAKTIQTPTRITLQAPFWARSGHGITFVGKVEGGVGCTMGRRVGLYQDAHGTFGGGQIAPFVRTGSWAGHSQGYWTITVNAPGRQFTRFYAVALFEYRTPSYAKPDRLACKYAITSPLPPSW
jgi:hypothetical protein